ncbi:MAG: GNAT family N-acetyltransferase [Candidatus Omnitrophica bacterium]|nr:GNAT family N-acetyltransferase [Candidatus Omnitrophota bacterium]
MKISPSSKKNFLRTRVIKKISDIPALEFNKIFPHVPEKYHFFKTLDEAGFHQFTFYYILVYHRKELVGAAPCFVVDYSLDTSISGLLRQLTNKITKIFPKLFSIKTLICGIPMGQGQVGLNLSYSGVLEAIETRLESLARKIKAPLMAFKDFDASYDKTFEPLLKKDYLKINSLPMTRLKINFSNFEEYLKYLGGDTRYDFRKKLKKAASVQIDSSIITHLDEQTLSEVYELYLQAVQMHDMNFEILPKDFFRLISVNMPQETKFFLWRMNGKLVAFNFFLVSDGVLLDYYLGFNYTLAFQYHLYFVRFKKTLDWGISQGLQVYEMGTTGYEPKRRLKFDLVPVYLYVKIRYKILRPFFKILCSMLKFENFDPELKKWKKSLK